MNIPINRTWMEPNEISQDEFTWNEVSFDYFILHQKLSNGLSIPLVYSFKKTEIYKAKYDNDITTYSTKTYLDLYDRNHKFIDKVYIEIETWHNDSSIPELKNNKVIDIVKQEIRKQKINSICEK